MCRFENKKLQSSNIAFSYQLANVFNLTSLYKETFSYIERCFSIFVENKNFLDLSFFLVSKLLASSELFITSELEVLDAANKWLSYNFVNRKKFGKNLLLKVRLHFLSYHTFEYSKNSFSSFCEIDDCNVIIKEVFKANGKVVMNSRSINCKRRYCNQTMFNFLVCGGKNGKNGLKVRNVKQVNVSDFGQVKILSPMKENRQIFQGVYLNGNVYVFGGYLAHATFLKVEQILPVEKYSPATDTWVNVGTMYDDRERFCACAFMDKIIIVGGLHASNYTMANNSCLEFGTKDYKFKELARIKQNRQRAACVVFEERIVVAGGQDIGKHYRSVESYDVFSDTWTEMPSMKKFRPNLSLVVVKNKLFAIGGSVRRNCCEMFDNSSKAFVLLSTPWIFVENRALSIGSKFYVIPHTFDCSVYSYDVTEDKWTEEFCEALKDVKDFSCVKSPFIGLSY